MFHASQTSPAILRTSSTEFTGAADMPFGHTRGDPTSAQNEACRMSGLAGTRNPDVACSSALSAGTRGPLRNAVWLQKSRHAATMAQHDLFTATPPGCGVRHIQGWEMRHNAA
jgi:hypothetical protein